MSDLRTRSAARVPNSDATSIPLVPPEIRARYAEAMMRIPHKRTSIHFARRIADPPAVRSFG